MTDPGLSRRDDPPTSKRAAAYTASNLVAAGWARLALRGGHQLIDEEIHNRTVKFGCALSSDRIRHGRLTLAELGEAILTGRTRKTSRGAHSREWTLKPLKQQGELFAVQGRPNDDRDNRTCAAVHVADTAGK